MRFYTHLMLSLFIGMLLLKLFEFDTFKGSLFIILACFFTLLPDIDEYHSKLGKRLGIISMSLNFLFGHRRFFHSILFMLLITIIIFPFDQFIAYSALTGILSHLCADSLTKEGISPLYPIKWRLKGFFQTGGIIEHIFFLGLFICILTLFINWF